MDSAAPAAAGAPTALDGPRPHVVVMGGGPAGLTAAWELTRHGAGAEVLEADPRFVGGIARTEEYQGFRFDIGGHRFFTKADEVREIWHQILDPSDWLSVSRMSRIYYRGKFFAYPLRAFDALAKLGVLQAALCVLSYLKARAFPRRDERSLEDWTINRFGERLYRIFFKTYTEKVWGMPCSEISADWAAQRIKGLSLTEAVRNAFPTRTGGAKTDRGGEVIKTLIDAFEYPRLGPGMMWEQATEQVRARGGSVELGARVAGVRHEDGLVTEVLVDRAGDRRDTVTGTDYVSTLPMRELVEMLDPRAPDEVRAAAAALRYRDYLTVVLIVDRADCFPDNWIYIHDPSVAVGRVQNYKNWSPEMVPDPARTALGLEYFCSDGDGLWETPDDELIERAIREITQIGLAHRDEIADGTVVRMRKAYPVYDEDYKRNVALVREWLVVACANLQLVGRNGMHKYNNQDHSMMTALLAARNVLGERCGAGERWAGGRDPWNVNTDAEYHEEVRADADDAGRRTPRRVSVTRG